MTYRPLDEHATPEARMAHALEHIAFVLDEWHIRVEKDEDPDGSGRLITDGGRDTSTSGSYRLADTEYRVEENPSEDEFFTDMLRIRRAKKKLVGSISGGEPEETWVEGTLANIPKKDGYAVLEALADYYDCEVRGR